MKSGKQAHLNEEQIVGAVIDEKELTGEDRQHLLGCRLCHGKVEQFRDELQELGENARLSVEPMTKKITLPREEPVSTGFRLNWFPSFGVAAMAGLVLFFYVLGLETMSPSTPAFQSAEALLEEEYLMEEIFEMVENPLSDELYRLTGDNGGFDDDFLQFVVPDIQEDFQSKHFIQGGIKQC